MELEFENEYLRYIVGSNGLNLHFIDKQTGTDYCDPYQAFARVKANGRYFDSSSAYLSGDNIVLEFGESNINAILKIKTEKHYLILEVISIHGEVDEFAFANIRLTLKGMPDEPYAGCAMALNLKTNVVDIPQPSSYLQAMCYPKFGFSGAQAAIIGCPQNELRSVMKEVVNSAPNLPKSPIGGPYAMDSEANRGSYMFNFGGLSEDVVDDWISLAQKLGISQIDFHGGSSFRFGDCRPNPVTYPNGMDSFKAVIDRLHSAGILAGLHTYAFFIDKSCPWVTPVPDPGLAKDVSFTLAEAISSDDAMIPVTESTEGMSTITGFFVRNSVTIQIDNELIIYEGLSPNAFTNCQRGAYNTEISSHDAGAKVHHLKECFGLFAPDPYAPLFEKVAESAANMYNKCGFDMMYLDALDGEDVLGGGENGWHYGSKYVFELWRRINKPAIVEMSTFHHHLWYVRSRMGAWDHPTRSHKKFIDIHCASNEALKRMLLPGHLGWWAVKTWSGHQGEPTFADDIEYLCCKCIGTDAGFSIMGIEPGNINKVPVYERLASIMKQYEELRHSGYFSDDIKAKLRVPGDEYTLVKDTDGKWKFQQAQYSKHKVEGIDGWSNVWTMESKFSRQPLQLRIESLMMAVPYDNPDNITLIDNAENFTDFANAPQVVSDVKMSKPDPEKGFIYSLSATNNGSEPRSAWSKFERRFSPTLDLSKYEGLGVWIYGDGQGEVLNFQLRGAPHISHGIGDHYVIVDFTGWRYFELIEPEGERHSLYSWGYGDAYSIYRESVNYSYIDSLSVWYNNVPKGGTVINYLSPVKALPLMTQKLVNPSITVGNKTIKFPAELESGSYIEFHSMSDCRLYGGNGELIGNITPVGEVPIIEKNNNIRFGCESANTRAKVTIIGKGDAIQ